MEAVAAPEEGPTLLLLLEAVEHGAVAAAAVARPPADHILGDAVEPGTRWKIHAVDRQRSSNILGKLLVHVIQFRHQLS